MPQLAASLCTSTQLPAQLHGVGDVHPPPELDEEVVVEEGPTVAVATSAELVALVDELSDVPEDVLLDDEVERLEDVEEDDPPAPPVASMT